MEALPVRRPVLLPALLLLAACGSAQATNGGSEVTASTLGGVGVLPVQVAELPAATAAATTATPPTPVTTTTTVPSTTTSTGAPATATTVATEVATPAEPTTSVAAVAALKVIGPAGARAGGNRVLVIGDSVLAGTTSRYSNDMCKSVVPLGWQVEVDAEVGRFIDFGDRVLDKRLSSGWDAAVIFLGSNYGDNQPVFASMLEAQVDRLSPRPVVLVTVTEFKPDRAEVNAAIRMIAFNHPNVSVVDWATISEGDGLLGGDGLHPSPQGREVLAQTIAAALGPAPAQPGKCLSTSFRDDSAGSVDTGTTAPVRTTTRRTTATKTTTKTTTKTATPTTSRSTTATTTNPTTETTADAPRTTVGTPKTTVATTPKTTDPPTTPKATPPPTPAPTPAPTTAAGATG